MPVRRLVRLFVKDQAGATAMEYALIGTLVAVALAGTFVVFGDTLSELFAGTSNRAGDAITRQLDQIN